MLNIWCNIMKLVYSQLVTILVNINENRHSFFATSGVAPDHI